MVGVSQGNGDPRACDFDLGLGSMSRTLRDLGFAVDSTRGCDFNFGFGTWRDLGFAVDSTGVHDFDFDFSFGNGSSSSVSMNSLLTIQVFFGPATMVSVSFSSQWASLW